MKSSLRDRLEAIDPSRQALRPPSADDAASDRLRAAVGAFLGVRLLPTLTGECPGLAFLIRNIDGIASRAESDAFRSIGAVVYFPGRAFTTSDFLAAVVRLGRRSL